MAKVYEENVWVGLSGTPGDGGKFYLIVADTIQKAALAAPLDVVSLSKHAFSNGDKAFAVIIAD